MRRIAAIRPIPVGSKDTKIKARTAVQARSRSRHRERAPAITEAGNWVGKTCEAQERRGHYPDRSAHYGTFWERGSNPAETCARVAGWLTSARGDHYCATLRSVMAWVPREISHNTRCRKPISENDTTAWVFTDCSPTWSGCISCASSGGDIHGQDGQGSRGTGTASVQEPSTHPLLHAMEQRGT
jgi:hypothetical protein